MNTAMNDSGCDSGAFDLNGVVVNSRDKYVDKHRVLELFIEAYKDMPELWNPTHSQFYNKCTRIRCIGKLKNILSKINPNATSDDVKRKINSLKSNYRRELRKIERSISTNLDSDQVYQPTTWTFYALQFLNEIYKPISQESQIEELESAAESSTSETKIKVHQSVERTLPQSTSKKRKKKEFDETQKELLENTNSYSSGNAVIDFDAELFQAQIWAHKLKSLAGRQKILAEKAINDILFEAQMGNLHYSSIPNKIERNS